MAMAHNSFADLRADCYAQPKPKKRRGRTIAGDEPSHRADRPYRASAGRMKRHPDVERHTIIIAEPSSAEIAPPISPTPTMIARSGAAPVISSPARSAGLYAPSRKGEAYGISSAAGTTMKRGGAVSRGECLADIRKRTQP
jgi:hypothetical protein